MDERPKLKVKYANKYKELYKIIQKIQRGQKRRLKQKCEEIQTFQEKDDIQDALENKRKCRFHTQIL